MIQTIFYKTFKLKAQDYLEVILTYILNNKVAYLDKLFKKMTINKQIKPVVYLTFLIYRTMKTKIHNHYSLII